MRLDSGVGAYNILRNWQRKYSFVGPYGSEPSQKKQKRSKLSSNVPYGPGIKIETSVSRSEAKGGSQKTSDINILEMNSENFRRENERDCRRFICSADGEVGEPHYESRNTVSAFDGGINILTCWKEVPRDLLLQNALCFMFFKFKTIGEERKNLQGSTSECSDTVECIDVDASDGLLKKKSKI